MRTYSYYYPRANKKYLARQAGRFRNPLFPKKKPRLSKRFYCGLAGLFLVIAGWLYFLFFAPIFTIKEWEIRGLEKYSKSEIESAMREFIGGKPVFIFKNSNIFVFSPAGLSKKLLRNFALESIEIKKYYPQKIIVNIREKQPKLAVYNNADIYVLANDGTIIMHKEGRAPADGHNATSTPQESAGQAPEAEAILPVSEIKSIAEDAAARGLPLYPIFYDATIQDKLLPNTKYPLSKIFLVIQKFLDLALQKTGLKFNVISVNKNKTGPQIIVYASNNWKIYMTAQEDGEKQFYKFYPLLSNQLKNTEQAMEYVDLRFGDRVYIK